MRALLCRSLLGVPERWAMARARALWLRCDLRLDDQPALQAACEGAESLLPVYVFDPAAHAAHALGARKSSARRARFLLESVRCLRRRLEARGSGLAVLLGPAHEALPRLCARTTVCVTKGVCSEELREEARVAKALTLRRVWGGTLYMPEECGCAPESVPLLFTAFKNRAESRGRIRDPLDPPRLPPLPQPVDPALQEELEEALRCLPSLEQLGYQAGEAAAALEDDPRGVMVFEGGEDAARRRLQQWMFDDDRLKEYFELRNGMLGEAYSSKLSPWLALGCISPRRIWKEAQRYEAERVKNKSTYWLIFELIWRDFFIYMALGQGDRIFLRGGLTGDKTPWNGSPDSLERWKQGRTGDPLVDANMRELKATGWMSNRGRQNVASYLIFDLGVDWRYGAAHFEELLLDYDPCSNWGNWVAAAGLTGQRVNRFNTKKQANDYDPRREYINHWLQSGAVLAPVSSGARAQQGPVKGSGRGSPAGGPSGDRSARGRGGRRWGGDRGADDGGYAPKRTWYARDLAQGD